MQALLEKALRARAAQESGDEVAAAAAVPHKPTPASKKEPSVKISPGAAPNFLAPTKAYQVQCVPNKAQPQMVITDEDLMRQEAEKREQIAAIRRKFKEQHKKIDPKCVEAEE